MEKTPGDQPPLWAFVAQNSYDFAVFGRVLARSTAKYLGLAFTAVKAAHFRCLSTVLKVKSAVLRRLMRRGSFFAPTPRLGLATVTSTTVFSLLFIPSLATLQSQGDLSQFLLESDFAYDQTSVIHSKLLVHEAEADLRDEVINYEIQPGDTLSTIGERFLVNVEALAYVNEISTSDLLQPGDMLKIPPANGLMHTVETGETVSSIAAKYDVSPQAVVDFNYLEEPFLLHAGDELVVPEAKIPEPEPVQYAAHSYDRGGGGLSLEPVGGASGTGGFTMPTSGNFTQFFSWYHPAIDISNKSCGSPVVAADSGTIVKASWWPGGGGNSIFVDHGNGYVTKYAHLSGFAKTGGAVEKGEVIGYVGQTGRAYGCHVHFIVEQNGRAINPLSVL